MKKIIYLLILMLFIGCKSKFNHYQGYIYNTDNKPIKNLIVISKARKNQKATSNENGFFKIKKSENWVEHFLYIKEDKNIIDSIQVLRTHPEYGIKYYFTDRRNDTIFINRGY